LKIQNLSIDYICAQHGVCETDKTRHIKTLPWLSVVVSTKGYYTIALDGNAAFDTQAGGCFIAPAGPVQDILHNTPLAQPMEMKWVFIDVKVNMLYKLDDLYVFPVTLPAASCDGILALIDKLLESDDTDILNVCLKNKLGFELLACLLPYAKPKKKIDQSIMPAINLIRNSYAQQLSVAQLANVCCMSVSTFIRKFKQATDTSPISYINNLRLSIASSLLITSDLSIGEISEQTGFFDQFYFSKSFRKKYGKAPKNYRNMLTNER